MSQELTVPVRDPDSGLSIKGTKNLAISKPAKLREGCPPPATCPLGVPSTGSTVWIAHIGHLRPGHIQPYKTARGLFAFGKGRYLPKFAVRASQRVTIMIFW